MMMLQTPFFFSVSETPGNLRSAGPHSFYSSITRLERPGLRPWCVSVARPTMRTLAHWPAEASAQPPGRTESTSFPRPAPASHPVQDLSWRRAPPILCAGRGGVGPRARPCP